MMERSMHGEPNRSIVSRVVDQANTQTYPRSTERARGLHATEGKIQLIIAHTGPLAWGGRLVAVPVEAVAIFGRQLASLDMQPEEYKSAATWQAADAQVLPPEEKIMVGLTRR
jgi:hypothetical protein